MGIHGLPFISPYLAVLLFYIASGFYMSMVINDKYARSPNWVGTFYMSRFLRLAPVYYVSLLLAFTMLVVTGKLVPALSSGWLLGALSNLTLVGLDYGFLADRLGVPDWRVISIAWTLAIEAEFYLLAPFVVTKSIRTVCVVLALFLASRAAVVWAGAEYYQWRYLFAPAVLCFFFIGVLAHRVAALIPMDVKTRYGWLGAAALILAAWLLGAYIDRPLDSWQFWSLYVVFALCVPLLFAHTKLSRIDRWLGELSYPVYLLHMPVAMLVLWVGSKSKTLASMSVVELNLSIAAATLALSWLMIRVERPVEDLRVRLQSRSTSPEVAGG